MLLLLLLLWWWNNVHYRPAREARCQVQNICICHTSSSLCRIVRSSFWSNKVLYLKLRHAITLPRKDGASSASACHSLRGEWTLYCQSVSLAVTLCRQRPSPRTDARRRNSKLCVREAQWEVWTLRTRLEGKEQARFNRNVFKCQPQKPPMTLILCKMTVDKNDMF